MRSNSCILTSIMLPGSVVSGTVTGLRQYGAFLELEGGMAGLLHISQISYERIDNLEQLFSVGQKCKVRLKITPPVPFHHIA
jgi:small subunit ribosomal protein S1